VPFDGFDIPTTREKVLAGERPKHAHSCPREVRTIVEQAWAQVRL